MLFLVSFGLDVSERVLCMCEVSLLDARDRPQALIAVGTGYLPSRGEDANPYGRVRWMTVWLTFFSFLVTASRAAHLVEVRLHGRRRS